MEEHGMHHCVWTAWPGDDRQAGKPTRTTLAVVYTERRASRAASRRIESDHSSVRCPVLRCTAEPCTQRYTAQKVLLLARLARGIITGSRGRVDQELVIVQVPRSAGRRQVWLSSHAHQPYLPRATGKNKHPTCPPLSRPDVPRRSACSGASRVGETKIEAI